MRKDLFPEDGRTARRVQHRSQILHAARLLIERNGTSALTMQSVASAAGLSRRTVYDHFGTRAGLLIGLAQQADADVDLHRRLGAVMGSVDAITALRALLELVADVTPGMLDLASAIERARNEDADANAAWADRMEDRLQGCRALAGWLRQEGRLRPDLDPTRAADVLYTAVSWQVWQILVTERGWTPQEWVEETMRLLVAALTTDEQAD